MKGKYIVTLKCKQCGNKFPRTRSKYRLRKSENVFCSIKCYWNHRIENPRLKENNPTWRRIKVKCSFCGTEKSVTKSHYDRSKHKLFFCDIYHASKWRNADPSRYAKRKPFKDKIMSGDGYIQIHYKNLTPEDYSLVKNMLNGNYILEHRLVVAKHVERELSSVDYVHHKDGNRSNNDIKNLELCDKSSHMKAHRDTLKMLAKVRRENARLRRKVKQLKQEIKELK